MRSRYVIGNINGRPNGACQFRDIFGVVEDVQVVEKLPLIATISFFFKKINPDCGAGLQQLGLEQWTARLHQLGWAATARHYYNWNETFTRCRFATLITRARIRNSYTRR